MKTVVVCGGSKGIGAATCKILVSKGYRVICVSRSLGELEELTSDKSRFLHLQCDLSNSNSRSLILEKLKLENNIWGLVNNASGPSTGGLISSTPQDYLLAFETHLFAANDLTKVVLPGMLKIKEGRIVNIISVTARIPLENMCVSNTLRGAMLNWSKTASKELGPSNITVNNILPGYTKTNRLGEVIQEVSKKMNISQEDYSKKILDQVPLKRFGDPEEVAAVVAFLLSQEASFISGASIPVDGGWTPCT